ncbi:MAG TPA: hypothetical protein VIK18_09285 [Pirellulales bacterium]
MLDGLVTLGLGVRDLPACGGQIRLVAVPASPGFEFGNLPASVGKAGRLNPAGLGAWQFSAVRRGDCCVSCPLLLFDQSLTGGNLFPHDLGMLGPDVFFAHQGAVQRIRGTRHGHDRDDHRGHCRRRGPQASDSRRHARLAERAAGRPGCCPATAKENAGEAQGLVRSPGGFHGIFVKPPGPLATFGNRHEARHELGAALESGPHFQGLLLVVCGRHAQESQRAADVQNAKRHLIRALVQMLRQFEQAFGGFGVLGGKLLAGRPDRGEGRFTTFANVLAHVRGGLLTKAGNPLLLAVHHVGKRSGLALGVGGRRDS